MRIKEIDINKTYGGQQIEVKVAFEVTRSVDDKIESIEVLKDCVLTIPKTRQIIEFQECASLRMRDGKEETDIRLMSTEVLDKALKWLKFNGTVDLEDISLEDGEALVELAQSFLGKAKS